MFKIVFIKNFNVKNTLNIGDFFNNLLIDIKVPILIFNLIMLPTTTHNDDSWVQKIGKLHPRPSRLPLSRADNTPSSIIPSSAFLGSRIKILMCKISRCRTKEMLIRLDTKNFIWILFLFSLFGFKTWDPKNSKFQNLSRFKIWALTGYRNL